VKDDRGRRLTYGKVGEAVFYRAQTHGRKMRIGSERFKLFVDNDALLLDEREPMQSLIDKITSDYNRHIGHVDGMKVRQMVREYIKHLNAVSIKHGVYFVHSSRVDELERLATLVDDRIGNGCVMHLVPLVDLAEQREKIVEAFQVEAEAALVELVKSIQRHRQTRNKITPAAYAKLKAEYNTVVSRAQEYTRTLGVSQERTANAAEIALDALTVLQVDMLGAAS
jgi:hypothetical protein